MLNKAACMGKAEKGHAQLNYFGTPSRTTRHQGEQG